MARLVNCFECGRSVSSAVKQCPHCNTYSPHGVGCGACGQRLRQSESALGGLHQSCFDYIYKSFRESPPLQFSCPVCNEKYHKAYRYKGFDKTPHDGTDGTSFSFTCNSCGHEFRVEGIEYPYGECFFCELSLNKSDSIRFQIYETSYCYAHRFCGTHHSQRLEQFRQKFQEDLAEKKYQKAKAEFWDNNGDDTPIGCAAIFALLLGGFLTLFKVWWLIAIGGLLILFAVVIFIEMIKYSR